MDLNEIRQEIDKIDSQLIELLEKRMDCTKAVGEYKLKNNIPILDTKRQQLIQGGTVLFGLEYMPISQLDLIGLIYLDCNDLIEVLDEEGNSIISRVFSHTIKYNGAISDNIETEGISINEETYKNKNTTSASNSRTEIILKHG